MAHRSRAALLRRTSQSAAASRALSVASTSNCRMVVRWRVTFFIGRYRSTRTLSLKDRRGGLKIQWTHRKSTPPNAPHKKTPQPPPPPPKNQLTPISHPSKQFLSI